MTQIDIVTHSLPCKMITDRQNFKIMPLKDSFARRAVVCVGKHLSYIELRSPARQFKAAVPKTSRFLSHVLKRQIRPLTSKQSD